MGRVAEAVRLGCRNGRQPAAIAMVTTMTGMALATAALAAMATAMAAMATTTTAVAAMVTAIVAMGTATAAVVAMATVMAVTMAARITAVAGTKTTAATVMAGDTDNNQLSTKRGSRRDKSCGDGRQWTTKARKIGWRTTMGKGRRWGETPETAEWR
jgi:hypothetical protein